MTVIEYPDLEQGSQEWLDARLGLVTASVIGKLITAKTVKPADNPESRGLTAQLVAERITGWSDPTFTSADMQRGHDVEPIARDWYAEKFGPVDELGFMVRTLPSGHRLGFSPDGLVADDGIIEIKAPRAKSHLLTHVSGEVPSYHMAQIQTGLLVSDRQWCDFISYLAGQPPFVKRVYADAKWFKAIEEAVDAFEVAAAKMQAQYEEATKGLPTTERVFFDLDLVA